MALSQIQCLDDNNVNPRIHESKPEFFYCEDQRLALEALLRYGREAFFKHLESRGLRGFLSDPELEALTAALEPFDPDSELFSGEAEDDPEPLSLQYWPEVSDTSLPQMDLGWPDCGSYRGVTRTFVYTQPPMEGQAHIKEVVRKMIAQAQKVIAVVMDVFTDVDIFQDLLDAGFKRKVSVYILLERTTLPHFLSMCQRANMHAGHLKHLRVRCTAGAEFHTRYCTKVRGQLGHRFMFIDGDKAVSGSYSFTWMSSRLDRNLITVITGQTVDAFDQLFRFLYMTSSFIDLRQVATEPEPEPDTRHQVLSVAPSSAAVVRKLYNPKYALVALSSPVNSSCNDGLKDPEISEDAKNKNKRKRPHEDLLQDVPPLHPGLIDLEKACLLSYLPTWPEPDPSSDVIGFINIRDFKKPTQVHLQRSEMFETSQAIKFSSPFIKPQETLPEVAQPRNQVAQSNSKSEDVLVDKSSVGLLDNKPKNMATEQKSLFKKEKLNPEKSDTKVVQTENKSCSNEATNPDLGPHFLSPNALLQSSTKALTPKNEQSQVLLTATLLEPLKESKSVKAHEIQTFLKTQSTFANPVNTLESSSGQKSTLHKQAQLNREDTEENKTKLYQVSHNTISDTQPKILSSEETHNLKNSLRPWNSAMSAASPIQSVGLLSKNNLSNSTTVPSTTAIISYNSHTSSIPTLSMLPSISSFSALLPSSTSAITSSDPQDSKPNTDQPLIQDSTTLQIVTKVSVSENLQSISAKNLENTVELQRNSISKTGNQENKLKTNICKDTNQETETVTYQTTMEKEADSKHNDKAEVHSFTDTPIETQSEVSLKTATVDFKTVKPESVDLKMHRDCITTTTDSKTSNKILTNLEFAKVANTAQTYHARSHEPQVISYSNFTLQDINILKPLNSSTARIDCVSHSTPIPKEKDGYSIKSAANALSQPDKQAQLQSLHSYTFQEQPCKTKEGAHTVIKTLHLHLSNAEGTQLSSETNKQESQLSAPIVQTLAPKVFPQNLPTLDSRTFSADPQTPTTEISDGYFSPREDSTTSEEYFECNESPSHEHVVDLAMRENNSPTYSNRPFSKNTTHTSPAGMGNILSAVALASAHQITASSESSTSVDPSASLFVSKGQNRGPKVTNKKIGKEESKIEVKRSNTDEKDMVHQSINGKNNKEFNQIRSPLNNDSETMKIDLNLSKDSRRQDDEGMAKSESAQKETKCLSIGELKPDSVLSEGKKVSSPKDKALNQSPQTPSNMDRRRRPTRETTGQKPLHPSPKSQPRQLPSIRGSSPSRPLRSPKTHSGYQVQETCPVRDLNQTESRAVQKNRKISDKPLFRKSQSRSPSPLKAAPIETVSGQKQVSQSPLRLLTRQPSAAQIHSKPDQPKCLTAKQHGSSLRTLSNLQAQVEPHASTDKVSEQAVNQPDEARVPFNLSFGRLYNFKGLREKWTKPPTQTRRSSTSTPVKERKSTT